METEHNLHYFSSSRHPVKDLKWLCYKCNLIQNKLLRNVIPLIKTSLTPYTNTNIDDLIGC